MLKRISPYLIVLLIGSLCFLPEAKEFILQSFIAKQSVDELLLNFSIAHNGDGYFEKRGHYQDYKIDGNWKQLSTLRLTFKQLDFDEDVIKVEIIEMLKSIKNTLWKKNLFKAYIVLIDNNNERSGFYEEPEMLYVEFFNDEIIID